MALIEGKVHDVIFQHDSTRVLQTCLKHGSDDCRAKLFTELKDHTIEIAKSKYGVCIFSSASHGCPGASGVVGTRLLGKC